jgi:DNA primase
VSVTDEIKSRLDIVDIVSDHVSLRKSGTSYTGFCPFHDNKRTPSFVVFPSSQSWRCFGACAEGGDIFSYVMKKNGWEFKEALTHLAQRAGVKLEDRPRDRAKEAAESKLGDLLGAAADYFHQLLLYAPQAEAARQYVAKRALTEETIATFQLGYALESWDACRNHFTMQGYTDDDLVEGGLLTENPEKGTRYDRFRNRLLFPIRNVEGRVVGFGARTLDPDGIPKYLNSPQTPLFDKSSLVYNLDQAKRPIREARQAVIVEGYMDVIQAWQAGFHNVVAQMGTALTEPQLGLLKRFTKRFVIALDADAAGAQATLRGLQVARQTLDRETEVRFDAHGLIRHEGRLQADIRIATMPEGKDPDNVIREDPAQWEKLIAEARPVVKYVIEVLTADLDLNDAKGKTAVAQQVLPLISDIADPIERDHYRQALARALRVDERALRQMPAPQKRPSIPPPPEETSRRTPGRLAPRPATLDGAPIGAAMRESNYLAHCWRYPQLTALVDGRLRDNQQPAVNEADFASGENRALFRHLRRQIAAIAAGLTASSVVTTDNLCDSLDDATLLTHAQTLLRMPVTAESEIERLPDRLTLSILDWRYAKTWDLIREVKRLIQEAKSANDQEMLVVYIQQSQELAARRKRISQAKEAMSSLSRRRDD